MEFVREGTNVVLGSIPVVPGTPVVGEGYRYDELTDGEIHQSSHFGNYVANEAPSFVGGIDQTVLEDAGAQTVATWATSISAGPATESGQTVDFIASNDHPTLFSAQPTVSADGSLTFTPAPNANGSALVTVLLHDNGGIGLTGADTSSSQTFLITVTAVNDGTAEDTSLNVVLSGVLTNDSDVDGDPLSVVTPAGPAHGSLTLNANGSFVYTPALNFNGPDSFTYQANDGFLNSNVAMVTITVAAVNDVPVATNDSYSTNQNVPLNVASRGVLLNDTDADFDPLSAVLATGPAHGSLVLNADGSFTYTPALSYIGSDSFTYRASDAVAQSGLATVSLTVVPYIPPTKFFVADTDRSVTFQYAADGSSLTNHPLNKSDGKPHGIASNSTGTIQWVIDGSGTVFVYDNLGNTVGQWQPQGVGKPEGITVWGNDLWLVDPTQDRVFAFARGATLRTGKVNATSSFALNSGNLTATDLVTDGAHRWVVNDTLASDKVFRYTTSGVWEGSWSISTTNPSPTGITLDPNAINHLWIVDASTDRVHQYDGAAARLTGSQEPSTTFALAATNTNPQGIADPMPAQFAQASGAAASGHSVDALSAVTPVGAPLHRAAVDRLMAGRANDSLPAEGIRNAIDHSDTTRRFGHEGSRRQASLADPNENSIGRLAFDEAIVADIGAAVNSDQSDMEALDRLFEDSLEAGRNDDRPLSTLPIGRGSKDASPG